MTDMAGGELVVSGFFFFGCFRRSVLVIVYLYDKGSVIISEKFIIGKVFIVFKSQSVAHAHFEYRVGDAAASYGIARSGSAACHQTVYFFEQLFQRLCIRKSVFIPV